KFGLETVVKQEVQALGFEEVVVSDGRIQFNATLADIPKANLWLRCADRVLLKISEFQAHTFDDLFEQTKALPWETWITPDGRFTVNAKSVKSVLKSGRSCQSIVKKAVVERLKTAYQLDWFPETGAAFTIRLALVRNTALLTIDTSGTGLHRRGYRAQAGEAPLKETFAAGLVKLTQWQPGQRLLDPMCGSGTVLIEAAMIGRNMAPGLNREFAAEGWPIIPAEAWQTARQEAKKAQLPSGKLQLFGSDIDSASIALARSNAQKAGVGDDIVFTPKDVKKLWIDQQFGVVITNPPYGIRMAEYRNLNGIYIAFNKTFRKKLGWAVNVLTADEKFPDYFKRSRPDKVRKLYNGTIKTNYYQWNGRKSPP
ncbi:23S rRNA (guanine(2445)-N(2))-methyltransferase, partial [hydrothermal vent metagenome]